MRPIGDIAKDLGLGADDFEPYGKGKAKLPLSLLEKILLFVEMALSLEKLLSRVVELLLDARLFAQRQLLGLDFRFLVPRAGLNFCFLDDLLGFFFRVALSQISQQLDDTHAQRRGHQRHNRDCDGV